MLDISEEFDALAGEISGQPRPHLRSVPPPSEPAPALLSDSASIQSPNFSDAMGSLFSARYRCTETLRETSLSRVFVATDTFSGRKVVVKSCSAERAVSLRREVQLASQLEQAGLIRVIDHGSVAGETETFEYSVSEWGGAKSWNDLGSWDEVADTLPHVLATLARLHESGWAHGAVRAQHIVVDELGVARLNGLESAWDLGEGLPASLDLGDAGQHRYLAPEALLGRADLRSDLFSLGMVLVGLTRRLGGLPPAALVDGIEALIHADPERRPASAQAAAELFGASLSLRRLAALPAGCADLDGLCNDLARLVGPVLSGQAGSTLVRVNLSSSAEGPAIVRRVARALRVAVTSGPHVEVVVSSPEPWVSPFSALSELLDPETEDAGALAAHQRIASGAPLVLLLELPQTLSLSLRLAIETFLEGCPPEAALLCVCIGQQVGGKLPRGSHWRLESWAAELDDSEEAVHGRLKEAWLALDESCQEALLVFESQGRICSESSLRALGVSRETLVKLCSEGWAISWSESFALAPLPVGGAILALADASLSQRVYGRLLDEPASRSLLSEAQVILYLTRAARSGQLAVELAAPTSSVHASELAAAARTLAERGSTLGERLVGVRTWRKSFGGMHAYLCATQLLASCDTVVELAYAAMATDSFDVAKESLRGWARWAGTPRESLRFSIVAVSLARAEGNWTEARERAFEGLSHFACLSAEGGAQSSVNDRFLAELKAELGFALSALGEHESAAENLEFALLGAEGLERFEVLMHLGHCQVQGGELIAAYGCYIDALSLAESGGLEAKLSLSQKHCGLVASDLGRYAKAIEHHQSGARSARLLGRQAEQIEHEQRLAAAYVVVGEFQLALSLVECAEESATELGLPELAGECALVASEAARWLGYAEQAAESLARAKEAFTALGLKPELCLVSLKSFASLIESETLSDEFVSEFSEQVEEVGQPKLAALWGLVLSKAVHPLDPEGARIELEEVMAAAECAGLEAELAGLAAELAKFNLRAGDLLAARSLAQAAQARWRQQSDGLLPEFAESFWAHPERQALSAVLAAVADAPEVEVPVAVTDAPEVEVPVAVADAPEVEVPVAVAGVEARRGDGEEREVAVALREAQTELEALRRQAREQGLELTELRAVAERPLPVLQSPSGSEPAVVSSAMQALANTLDRLRLQRGNVTFRGGAGTGKMRAARSLYEHRSAPRGGWWHVACDQLGAGGLLTSFRAALLAAGDEAASEASEPLRGTLVLARVEQLGLEAQRELLMMLSERCIDGRKIADEFCIIATTRCDLTKRGRQGGFNDSLLQQLGPVISIPRLKQRAADLPGLVEAILARLAGATTPVTVSAGALARLATFAWPGNIRQLEEELAAAVLRAQGGEVQPQHLRPPSEKSGPVEPQTRVASERAESAKLATALDAFDWNVRDVSRALAIPRATLYRKLKKYGLQRPSA